VSSKPHVGGRVVTKRIGARGGLDENSAAVQFGDPLKDILVSPSASLWLRVG
jgi:hypothetical protein